MYQQLFIVQMHMVLQFLTHIHLVEAKWISSLGHLKMTIVYQVGGSLKKKTQIKERRKIIVIHPLPQPSWQCQDIRPSPRGVVQEKQIMSWLSIFNTRCSNHIVLLKHPQGTIPIGLHALPCLDQVVLFKPAGNGPLQIPGERKDSRPPLLWILRLFS